MYYSSKGEMTMKQKKSHDKSLFKKTVAEIRESILFDLLIEILIFIPRLFIRLLKNIF